MSSPPCHACRGVCCHTDSGWHFVELTYKEQRLPLFKKHVTVGPTGTNKGFCFTQPVGSGGKACPFFDLVERKCKIYSERPMVCRAFDCRNCQPEGRFFQRNPHMVQLLKQHQDKSHDQPAP